MSARIRRKVGLTLAAAGVALGLLAVVSRATTFDRADIGRNDFAQDYASARALSDGSRPYSSTTMLLHRYVGPDRSYFAAPSGTRRNPHPPLQIVFTMIFSGFGFAAARVVWLAINAASFVTATYVVARAHQVRKGPALALSVTLLALPVVQKDLTYANGNGFLLLLIVMGWDRLRRGDDLLGGSWLGAAAALRIFPVLLLIPVIRMRRTVSAWGLVVTAAVLSLAGAVVIGSDSLRFLGVSADNVARWRAAPMNISGPAVAFRWLTKSFWRPHGFNAPEVATALAALAALACVIVALRTAARVTGDSFLAALPLVLLAVPIAWDYYLVLVVPTAIAAVVRTVRERGIPPPPLTLSLAVLALGVPPGLPPASESIPPITLLLGFGLPTYGLVALAAADYRRTRAEPAEA